MSYIGIPPFGQTIRSVTNVTATASQTTFNITGGYQVGYVDVYLNGVLLVPDTDYTATDGLTVELATGASSGDAFQALSYQPVSLIDCYTQGQTDTLLAAKQDTLVSGTNIKTINSTSLLGSGDISITSSPAGSNTYVQYNNSGSFGGSANFVFDGTNVGIGTSSPAYNLDVGSSSSTTQARIAGSSSGTSLGVLRLSGYRIAGDQGSVGAIAFTNQNTTDTTIASIYGYKEGTSATDLGYLVFNTKPTGSAIAERMRITSSGNVGIGSSSPVGKLDVYTAGGTTAYFRDATVQSYYGSNTANGFSGTGTNHPFVFLTNNTERMRIDSSGNLLVGTTTSRNKLTVAGTATSTPTLGTASGAALFAGTDMGYGTMIGTGSSGVGWIQQQRVDGTGTAYDLLLQPAGGNVGIGTSSPAVKLDVVGSASFGAAINTGNGVSTGDVAIELGGNRTGSGNSYIDFHSVASTDYEARIIRVGGANGALQILNSGTGDFRMQASGAAPMIFDTSATERMRIDSSGNVGIGTSSTSGKVRCYQTADAPTLTLTSDQSGFLSSNQSVLNIVTTNGTSNPTTSFAISASYNGSTLFSIRNDGNLQFNSGYGSAATAYGCRAWVNFNGTGTVAIRASGNVSSITDVGTGMYTVNLSTALVDANYSPVTAIKPTSGASSRNGKVANIKWDVNLSTTSFTLWCYSTSGDEDFEIVSAGVFR